MKRVAAMALAEKQNEGLTFENRTVATLNDILPDDEENEAFDKIDGNITGVEMGGRGGNTRAGDIYNTNIQQSICGASGRGVK